MKFGVVWGFVIAAAVTGCSTTRVRPISLLSEHTKATYYADRPVPPRETREVAVDQLVPILARATWISDRYVGKGGFWLRFPDGRELFVAIGFEFFRERDVPGTFVIRPEDVAAFHRAVDDVQRSAGLLR